MNSTAKITKTTNGPYRPFQNSLVLPFVVFLSSW